MVKKKDYLTLDNQLCFALYVCSKEIIRMYKPHLEPFNLTYTGYITMMALWEQDNISVKELGKRLFLDSGTLTPLLKKLEAEGYAKRTRSEKDERTVIITLTDKGRNLKLQCGDIPKKMTGCAKLSQETTQILIDELHCMMQKMQKNQQDTET